MTHYNTKTTALREASEDERGELYDFVEREFDATRSDAQGIVDTWTIVVYDNCKTVIPQYTGTVLTAIAGGRPSQFYIFTWEKGSLCLAREYTEVPGMNRD